MVILGRSLLPGPHPSHPTSTLPPSLALTRVTTLMPMLTQMMRPNSNRMELPISWQLLVLGFWYEAHPGRGLSAMAMAVPRATRALRPPAHCAHSVHWLAYLTQRALRVSGSQ
jgi:hypothetical protein